MLNAWTNNPDGVLSMSVEGYVQVYDEDDGEIILHQRGGSLVIMASIKPMEGTFPHLVGLRVRVQAQVDRFPHFTVEKGAAGTIESANRDQIAVKMDAHIPDCEEWNNCVMVYATDAHDSDPHTALWEEWERIPEDEDNAYRARYAAQCARAAVNAEDPAASMQQPTPGDCIQCGSFDSELDAEGRCPRCLAGAQGYEDGYAALLPALEAMRALVVAINATRADLYQASTGRDYRAILDALHLANAADPAA